MSALDSEIAALTLQLHEIQLFTEGGKGKYVADRPSDCNVAFARFEEELRTYESILVK